MLSSVPIKETFTGFLLKISTLPNPMVQQIPIIWQKGMENIVYSDSGISDLSNYGLSFWHYWGIKYNWKWYLMALNYFAANVRVIYFLTMSFFLIYGKYLLSLTLTICGTLHLWPCLTLLYHLWPRTCFSEWDCLCVNEGRFLALRPDFLNISKFIPHTAAHCNLVWLKKKDSFNYLALLSFQKE